MDDICFILFRQNLVQIQIYYETLVTTRDEQMLEFTSEDLTGKKTTAGYGKISITQTPMARLS